MASRIYTSVVTVGDIEIYQVGSNPNGSLEARQGSLAVRNDTALVYQNTDGGTTWAQLGGGGSFEYDVVTVLGAASGDLSAEPTRNIAYEGSGLNFTQELPDPAGARKLYRLVNLSIGESTITLAYAAGSGVVGVDALFGAPTFGSITVVADPPNDRWIAFPGAIDV